MNIKNNMLSAVRKTLFHNPSHIKTGIIRHTKSLQKLIYTGKYTGRNPAGRRVIEGRHNVHFDKDFIPLSRDTYDAVKKYLIDNVVPLKEMHELKRSVGIGRESINVQLYSTHVYAQNFV